MASLTQWTWVWVDSGSWWWTGRPGVLWFMGSQTVRHDWGTELNWTEQHVLLSIPINLSRSCSLGYYSNYSLIIITSIWLWAVKDHHLTSPALGFLLTPLLWEFFFNVDHFLSLYWICYHIASVVHVLVFWPWSMGNLNFPTRGQTLTSCVGRWSLNHSTIREVPMRVYFWNVLSNWELGLLNKTRTYPWCPTKWGVTKEFLSKGVIGSNLCLRDILIFFLVLVNGVSSLISHGRAIIWWVF